MMYNNYYLNYTYESIKVPSKFIPSIKEENFINKYDSINKEKNNQRKTTKKVLKSNKKP